MFENYNVKVSEKYLFLFDKRFDYSIQEELMTNINHRFDKLSQVIQLDCIKWKKPYYIFDLIFDNETISGRAYDGIIKCRIPNGYTKDMPMIHEEAHMITFYKWGKLPYAWSEGLAEYIVAIYNGDIDLLTGKAGDIINIKYRPYVEEIINSLIHDDWEYFNYIRSHNIFYAMSLASIIYYIELVNSKEEIEYVVALVKNNCPEKLDCYLRDSVLFEWFAWLDEERE